MRSDSVTEDGRRIEKYPETMATHFLDVYGIDYAVLNPMESMEHCVSPDAHYSGGGAIGDQHLFRRAVAAG